MVLGIFQKDLVIQFDIR